MLSEAIKIPTDIKDRLEKFVKQAQVQCADNLISICLYGGAAKEEFEANYSDINILIVMKVTDIPSLDALNLALEKPIYKIALAPFIISRDELENAAGLFPVKFHDIKRNHITLYGEEDLLSDLSVNEELLKRNSRRELKNILFRLNNIYIHNHATEEVLGAKIKGMFPSILIHLNIMCYLKDSRLVIGKKEIIDHAALLFNLDKSLLSELYEYKKGQKTILNKDIKKWYGLFMSLVKEISTKADSL